MTSLNRRALLSLAAAMAAAPAWAQEATTEGGTAAPAEAATPSGFVDFTLGDAAAPVKIVEYASFTCPHCANFHATVFKPLKAEFIDTGKVHFTLREVYFDQVGFWAALVARCGDGKRYEAISDMLFTKQSDWLNSQDPQQIMENLRVIGVSAGLTREEIAACEKDTASGELMLSRFQENMEKDQITGTPSVFLDGEKVADWSWDTLKASIEAKLAG